MIASSLALLLAATPMAASPPSPEPQKLICRRFAETGSLVKKKRICHTKAEWARLSANTRQEWGELQGTKGSTNGK